MLGGEVSGPQVGSGKVVALSWAWKNGNRELASSFPSQLWASSSQQIKIQTYWEVQVIEEFLFQPLLSVKSEESLP